MPGSYYLYGRKVTRTLNELRVSVFTLTGTPLAGTVSVTYDGITYDRWFLAGNELHLVHHNPDEFTAFHLQNYSDLDQRAWMNSGFLGDSSRPIQVSYDYLVWNSGTQVFDVTAQVDNLTVQDDETETYYQLHSDMPPFERVIHGSSDWNSHTVFRSIAPQEGPTVVTDDDIQHVNAAILGSTNEFSVDSETAKLSFHPTENLLQNPGFQVANESTGSALGWTKLDTATPPVSVAPSTNLVGTPSAVYGERTLGLLTQETLYQTIRLRERKNHHISFYAYVDTADPVRLTINPVDASGNYRNAANEAGVAAYDDATEIYLALFTPEPNKWNRFHAFVGEDGTFYTSQGQVLGVLPGATTSLEVRVVAPSSNSVTLDAIQVHEGADHAPFLGIAGDATIEFESSSNALYIPKPSDSPFVRDEVDVNPIRSQKPDGFLAFYDDGMIEDFQLGKGGNFICKEGIQSVNVLGRTQLAYARTDGLGKYVERQITHRTGWPIDDNLAPVTQMIGASEADELPPENSFTTDDGFLHFLTSDSEETALNALFYDQFKNPVPSEAVTVSQVGSVDSAPNTTVYTDRAGRARFVHVPRDADQLRETITFSMGNVQAIFIADILG